MVWLVWGDEAGAGGNVGPGTSATGSWSCPCFMGTTWGCPSSIGPSWFLLELGDVTAQVAAAKRMSVLIPQQGEENVLGKVRRGKLRPSSEKRE